MSRNLLRRAAIVTGGAAVGAGIICLGVPAAVGVLGFGSSGITAGSTAAWMMSLSGGATQAGGIVATCQSIGAAGVATSTGVLGSVAGGITGWFAGGNDNQPNDDEPDPDQGEKEQNDENKEDEEQSVRSKI